MFHTSKLFYKHEKKKYSRFGYFNTNFPFFNSLDKLDKKLIIISGPARFGNHLLVSLLDGTKELPIIPGEDDLIRNIFTQFKILGKKKFLKKLKNTFEIIINSTLQPLNDNDIFEDKLKKLHKVKKKDKIFKFTPGKKKANKGHLINYPKFKPKLNYDKYKSALKYNLENSDLTFKGILNSYFDANLHLMNPKKNFNQYLFASSGIRRELDFLCSKLKDIKVIVPIRNFESFYFSYSMSRFKTMSVNKKVFKELWEHWYHKVNDYYILKKKYPKKFIFIKYEKIVNNPQHLKKLFKKLNLTFSKKNLIPTISNKKVYGNTSHSETKDKFGRIYNNSYLNEKRFDLEIFGKNKKDYLRMKKELNKLCL